MKLYDWIIAILIGALLLGAYFVFTAIEPSSPVFDDPSQHGAVVRSFMRNLGVAILAFTSYFLLFVGAAAALRSTAASALLLFLIGLGLQIFPRYLLFIGWSDDSDVDNRLQLVSVADWFSTGILLLSAVAFGAAALFGLLRRISAGTTAD